MHFPPSTGPVPPVPAVITTTEQVSAVLSAIRSRATNEGGPYEGVVRGVLQVDLYEGVLRGIAAGVADLSTAAALATEALKVARIPHRHPDT